MSGRRSSRRGIRGEGRRRRRADADGERASSPSTMRPRGTAHAAVLRRVLRERPSARTAVGLRQARPRPWDDHAADDRPVRAGRVRPEDDVWRSSTHFSQAKDLAAEHPEAGRAQRASGRGGGAGTALLGRFSVYCRDAAPMPTATKRTSTETSRTSWPAWSPYGHYPYAITGRPAHPGRRRGRHRGPRPTRWAASPCSSRTEAPPHAYSLPGVDTGRKSTEALPGDVTVRVQFDADAAKPGAGGDVTLWIAAARSARVACRRPCRSLSPGYGGMDVGRDNGCRSTVEAYGESPYGLHRDREEGRVRPGSHPQGERAAERCRGAPTQVELDTDQRNGPWVPGRDTAGRGLREVWGGALLPRAPSPEAQRYTARQKGKAGRPWLSRRDSPSKHRGTPCSRQGRARSRLHCRVLPAEAGGRPPNPSACSRSRTRSRAHLVPVRHGRMMVSPFTFYRGRPGSWPPTSRTRPGPDSPQL